MAVIEHGTIDHTLVAVGKMLQILIVCGDDAVGLAPAKLLEHRLGNSPADLRFRAGAKLIDKQQRTVVGTLHHVLHVEQMTRIGAQVIFYALLVANVDEDMFKDARCRAFAHRDGNATLQHILQQTSRFQTY